MIKLSDYVVYDESSITSLRWVYANNPKVKVGSEAGTANPAGYFRLRICKKLYYAHRVVWELCNGPLDPSIHIDHIDGDKSNNKLSNLRLADSSSNLCNRYKQSNNTSGYKGVYWVRHLRKWNAKLNKNGVTYNLGLFTDISEAANAYRQAALNIHGPFAKW